MFIFICVAGKMLSRFIRTHRHVWLQLVSLDYSSVGLSSMIGHFRIYEKKWVYMMDQDLNWDLKSFCFLTVFIPLMISSFFIWCSAIFNLVHHVCLSAGLRVLWSPPLRPSSPVCPSIPPLSWLLSPNRWTTCLWAPRAPWVTFKLSSRAILLRM